MASSQTKTDKVHAAIHTVASILTRQGISKDRVNQHQQFNFRGIDDVLNALSGALVEAKLAILPSIVDCNVETHETTKTKGGRSYSQITYIANVFVEYTLLSTEDGSTQVVRFPGFAFDQSDKAVNKALSAAYKYMALQTFCIPVEGLPDADQDDIRHDSESSEPAPQAEPPQVPHAENVSDLKDDIEQAASAIRGAGTLEDLKKAFGRAYKWARNRKLDQVQEQFQSLYEERKEAFESAAESDPLTETGDES